MTSTVWLHWILTTVNWSLRLLDLGVQNISWLAFLTLRCSFHRLVLFVQRCSMWRRIVSNHCRPSLEKSGQRMTEEFGHPWEGCLEMCGGFVEGMNGSSPLEPEFCVVKVSKRRILYSIFGEYPFTIVKHSVPITCHCRIQGMHTERISLMDIQRVIQLVCWFVYIFEAIYIYLHRFITPLSDQSV